MQNHEISKTIIQYNPRFYPIMGGGEVHVANIVKGLSDYNFKIVTNALYGYPLVENFSQNVQILRFLPNDRNLIPFKTKSFNKALFPYKLLSDIIRQKQKYSYLKNSSFDLLHIHGIGFESNFLKTDRILNCTMFTKLIDFSFIDIPKVITIHNLFSPFTQDKLSRKFEQHIINQFENIIVVDQNIKSYVEDYVDKTGQNKNIIFVPNSVDTQKFNVFNYVEDAKLKVGFIGRLEASRGLELLYKLIKNLPEYIELYIVGSGNENNRSKFEANIDVSKINYYTNLKNEDIPEFIGKIDILFNPVLAEGISRVSLEAMSCGKPVIMLDKGNRYPIIKNKTGYLIQTTDELLQLLQYLQDNRSEIREVGKNARKIVENEFSNDFVIPKISKIYKSLI